MVADEGKIAARATSSASRCSSIREELGESGRGRRDRGAPRAHPPRPAPRGREQDRARSSSVASRGMQQQSAEYNVTRTYLEWLADLPWSKTTNDKLEPADVRRCLDEDHFGLEKVKKRIVEYMAVRKLRADKKGPILLLHRAARRRQDVARSLDRALDGPPLPPHRARRRARRGRDPRSPPHLRRRAAGPHHPGPEEGRRRRTRSSCSTRSTSSAST